MNKEEQEVLVVDDGYIEAAREAGTLLEDGGFDVDTENWSIGDAHMDVGSNVMPYIVTDPDREALKTKEEELIEEMLPESRMLGDYVFGPNRRLQDEPFEAYKARRKADKAILKLRMREGINTWPAGKGQFTDPQKQTRKAMRKIQKANRETIPRLKRIEMGVA